jgi:hypothetical protein
LTDEPHGGLYLFEAVGSHHEDGHIEGLELVHKAGLVYAVGHDQVRLLSDDAFEVRRVRPTDGGQVDDLRRVVRAGIVRHQRTAYGVDRLDGCWTGGHHALRLGRDVDAAVHHVVDR